MNKSNRAKSNTKSKHQPQQQQQEAPQASSVCKRLRWLLYTLVTLLGFPPRTTPPKLQVIAALEMRCQCCVAVLVLRDGAHNTTHLPDVFGGLILLTFSYFYEFSSDFFCWFDVGATQRCVAINSTKTATGCAISCTRKICPSSTTFDTTTSNSSEKAYVQWESQAEHRFSWRCSHAFLHLGIIAHWYETTWPRPRSD